MTDCCKVARGVQTSYNLYIYARTVSHSYGLKYCTDSKTIYTVSFPQINIKRFDPNRRAFEFHCQSLYSFIYVELDYFSQIVDSLALYLFS